jgi:hypothetical protein
MENLPVLFGYVRAFLETLGLWGVISLAIQAVIILSLVQFLIKRFQ